MLKFLFNSRFTIHDSRFTIHDSGGKVEAIVAEILFPFSIGFNFD